MYKYLETWKSGMPAIQGAQVGQILTAMQEEGLIRTEEEYRNAINRISAMIRGTDPIPTVKLFYAVLNEYADSESYNWMIERLRDDLSTGFGESELIGEVLEAHQKVYEEFTLAKLRSLIETIREEVNLHVLLRQNSEGFSNLQYNTFAQNSKSTTTKSSLLEQLFFDRSSKKMLDDDPAIIDAINESLELNPTKGQFQFVEVQEVDTDTTLTDYTYELPNNDISNMIDGTNQTYYTKVFFMEDIVTGGAQVKFFLDPGKLSPINYVEVQPVADYPFQVSNIEYTDKEGNLQDVELQESGILNQDIFRPIVYHFKKVDARYVYVTLNQPHYTMLNFHGSSLMEATPAEDFYGTNLESEMVQDAVRSVIDDEPFLQNFPEEFDDELLLYQYVIGFDNIVAGEIAYEELGIFVSEVFSVARCRRIGLDADEVDTNETLTGRRASFEYWIYKQDYNADGGIIATTALPILSLSDIRVFERLELLETIGATRPNTGTTRFQGHYGAGAPTGDEEIKVYSNGVELTYLTDWEFEDLGILNNINYTRIKLTAVTDEVYTVEYTPVQFHPGNTERGYQRFQPNAYYKGDNNLIFTHGDIGSEEVEESDVYLIVIMKRNNIDDNTQSPKLNEYSLLVASQDPTRLYPES